MNYSKIYNDIMVRATTRTLSCYAENHHIIPKCMGGSDCKTNLVKLTPEEHYLAHQLLVKIHPGNKKLVYAAAMMCNASGRLIRNNKMYGWIRNAVSQARKNVPKTDAHKKKLSDANINKILSDETCAKMSKSRIGNTNGTGNKGKRKPPRTATHAVNLSKALKKPKSITGKENIGKAHKKRSIDITLSKKSYYESIFHMIDKGISIKEIRSITGVKEREFYTVKKNRLKIETIIKENTNAF